LQFEALSTVRIFFFNQVIALQQSGKKWEIYKHKVITSYIIIAKRNKFPLVKPIQETFFKVFLTDYLVQVNKWFEYWSIL